MIQSREEVNADIALNDTLPDPVRRLCGFAPCGICARSIAVMIKRSPNHTPHDIAGRIEQRLRAEFPGWRLTRQEHFEVYEL